MISVMGMHVRRISAQGWKVLLLLLMPGSLLLFGLHPEPPISSTGTTAKPSTLVPTPTKPYEFPAGGQKIFPGYRMIALYGVPNSPALGVLGAQPLKPTLSRVKAMAKTYQPYAKETMLPTLEIITTIASASPTDNNDYSRETDQALLRLWVEAARQAGVYVVLDLQPGRTSFLTQAKQYEALLKQPNVGLALDPEWRLARNQVPLEQIGSVNIREVNATAEWLAALAAKNRLPQKLFLLHEFRLSMLPERKKLNTSHPELAYAIQMDGQGPHSTKLDTWRAILADPPSHVHFGWKNFYHKDPNVLSPQATMRLSPQPWYVSYQ